MPHETPKTRPMHSKDRTQIMYTWLKPRPAETVRVCWLTSPEAARGARATNTCRVPASIQTCKQTRIKHKYEVQTYQQEIHVRERPHEVPPNFSGTEISSISGSLSLAVDRGSKGSLSGKRIVLARLALGDGDGDGHRAGLPRQREC